MALHLQVTTFGKISQKSFPRKKKLNSVFLCRSSAISNELAFRGHNVTVISADEDKYPPKNVHYIRMKELYNDLYHEVINGFFTFRKKMNPLTAPNQMNQFWFNMCKCVYFWPF